VNIFGREFGSLDDAILMEAIKDGWMDGWRRLLRAKLLPELWPANEEQKNRWLKF
jgi:hypothetical protein